MAKKSKILVEKKVEPKVEPKAEPKVEPKPIITKNDLYVNKLEKIKSSIDKVIKELEELNDGQRFDQIQNLIGHLEKLF